MFDLRHGDCLDVLRGMADNSVDAIVTDPPYGLSFMGKRWDYDVPSEDIWRECLRVLKPGGHLLAFAGTRTQHRMAVRIEDAGFEIRDLIAWVYGSGFPKSLDVSKAIDKAAGVEFESEPASGVGFMNADGRGGYNVTKNRLTRSGEQTLEAEVWHGWGTALKPALEPITVARKPLIGTVAENVLTWGTGGVNVDGCRIASSRHEPNARDSKTTVGVDNSFFKGKLGTGNAWDGTSGRWPANLIHDGSEEVVGLFPANVGANPNNVETKYGKNSDHLQGLGASSPFHHNDGKGSAARFFYCAKASKADRGNGNAHPTVKPTDLMRYLCRLVTPPGGTVLDPFMGSGSTGKAAVLEGFNFIGIEREAEYLDIARARIEHVTKEPNLWQS